LPAFLFYWRQSIMAERPAGEKIVATNKKAFHDYFVLEKIEAGVSLLGTEVKAIREGRLNLKDSYAMVQGGEAFLLNCHISPYSHGNRENHDPTRSRKLLLHQREIRKLIGKTQEKGLTLVPLRVYLKRGRIKIELGVARGKKLIDKRETERRKEADREARAAMKHRR
jgi:SsrA-binding protein